jgi:hypothetical protein
MAALLKKVAAIPGDPHLKRLPEAGMYSIQLPDRAFSKLCYNNDWDSYSKKQIRNSIIF